MPPLAISVRSGNRRARFDECLCRRNAPTGKCRCDARAPRLRDAVSLDFAPRRSARLPRRRPRQRRHRRARARRPRRSPIQLPSRPSESHASANSAIRSSSPPKHVSPSGCSASCSGFKCSTSASARSSSTRRRHSHAVPLLSCTAPRLAKSARRARRRARQSFRTNLAIRAAPRPEPSPIAKPMFLRDPREAPIDSSRFGRFRRSCTKRATAPSAVARQNSLKDRRRLNRFRATRDARSDSVETGRNAFARDVALDIDAKMLRLSRRGRGVKRLVAQRTGDFFKVAQAPRGEMRAEFGRQRRSVFQSSAAPACSKVASGGLRHRRRSRQRPRSAAPVNCASPLRSLQRSPTAASSASATICAARSRRGGSMTSLAKQRKPSA